jgi:hypothetical protein
MTETTDALELLTEQHAEVDELFEKIEKADDSDEKAELFRELADKLAAHSSIEEKIFYPAVMAEETSDLLLEFSEEHLAAKRVLADLLALDPEDEHWDAKLTVLKEEIRHHAHDEEEGKLFPMLEKQLSADQRAGLGNELLAAFEELLEQEPRMQVPSETSEAAHLEAYY